MFYKEDVDKAGKSFDVITEIEIDEKIPEESDVEDDKELWEDWKRNLA